VTFGDVEFNRDDIRRAICGDDRKRRPDGKVGGVVRDAAERFCKEMLIEARRASGDGTASLNDYDRKNLGELGPQVETLLTLDPFHPGKLRAIGGAVNPTKHDDSVPAAGVLKVALGDLRFLKKNYL
jgi:hypothetical protein